MKKLLASIVLLLSPVAAVAQDSGLFAVRGDCVMGSPRMYFVVDASVTGGCSAGGGTNTEAQCCCIEGAWAACTSGGSGAPTTADYLVKTADGGLSAERVVTDTSSLAWDWGTAGQAKANVANIFLPASSPPAIDAASGVWGVSGGVRFEGATADGIETTVGVIDPTASDKSLNFPNENGTLLSTGSNYAASVSPAGPATTATAFVTNPADCSTADGTEFAWRIQANGDLACTTVQTSFGQYDPMNPPASCGTGGVCDEFTSGITMTFNGWQNQESSTITAERGGVTIAHPTDLTGHALYYFTGPNGSSTDWTMHARLSAANTNTFNYEGIAILATGTEASPTLFYAIVLFASSSSATSVGVRSATSYTASLSALGTDLPGPRSGFAKISYVSSSKALSFFFSDDGYQYKQLHTLTLGAHPTTSFALAVGSLSSTTNGSAHVQFLRVRTDASQANPGE